MKSISTILGLMLVSMAAADLPYNLRDEPQRGPPTGFPPPHTHTHWPTGTGTGSPQIEAKTTFLTHTGPRTPHPTGTGGAHNHTRTHTWVPPSHPTARAAEPLFPRGHNHTHTSDHIGPTGTGGPHAKTHTHSWTPPPHPTIPN